MCNDTWRRRLGGYIRDLVEMLMTIDTGIVVTMVMRPAGVADPVCNVGISWLLLKCNGEEECLAWRHVVSS